LRKNLARIIFTAVFIILAVISILPTYKDYKLSQELIGKSGQDSVDFLTQNSNDIRKAKEKRIKLGLDLKGGMYVVLDVDVIKLLDDISKKKDSVLTQILSELKSDLKERELANKADESILNLLIAKLKTRGLTLKSYYGDIRDDEASIEKRLNEEIENTIDRAVQVVRSRVDQYGVAEPQIQKIGNKRIIVELPGVSNPDDVEKLLQGTALLQFQLLYDPQSAFKVMQGINTILAGSTDSTATDSSKVKDTTNTKTAAGEKNKKDSTKVTKTDTTKTKKEKDKTDKNKKDTTKTTKKDSTNTKDSVKKEDSSQAVQDSISQMSEEERRKKFPFFFLVQLTQQSGADGYVKEGSRPQVDYILKRPDIQAVIPSDLIFAWSQKSFEIDGEKYYILYALKKEAELTGKVVENARAQIDPNSNAPIVTMSMNSDGASDWARITGANINKRCAIVLDGLVYSAPNIKNKITGGNSQIEGMANIQEAKLLEIVLKAGALPAPLRIIEERSIGPSLGEDSIRKGVNSSLAALIMVALFMIVYYRLGGVVADFALIINVLFVIGIMASLKATFTLPGIAGLVLTLGMAVDTNVLIFERIREELDSGKPLKTCVEIGYKRAFSAIIDSHITSVITGLILYEFGSGPIQGFALTLLFGVMVNLFTAIVITHFIFDIMLEKGRHVKFG
jgi:preprotein translocase subunit SecD